MKELRTAAEISRFLASPGEKDLARLHWIEQAYEHLLDLEDNTQGSELDLRQLRKYYSQGRAVVDGIIAGLVAPQAFISCSAFIQETSSWEQF